MKPSERRKKRLFREKDKKAGKKRKCPICKKKRNKLHICSGLTREEKKKK